MTGLLIAFGVVGGIENNPDASLLSLTAIAIAGLFLMHSGARAIGRKYE